MPSPSDHDTSRHRCEVRQLLRWRKEHGSQWVRDWLARVAKARGQDAADALNADATRQWQAGNRGGLGDWR